MNKNQSEIFAEFTYGESLTYEELLQHENMLIEQLDLLFKEGGAEHLDFTPQGDLLMLQCAFEIRNLEILRDISREIAVILPKGIRGRMLCLEKDLTLVHIFWIDKGQWQEKEYVLPKKGPEDAPIHKL